jgi:hypothetical protein
MLPIRAGLWPDMEEAIRLRWETSEAEFACLDAASVRTGEMILMRTVHPLPCGYA